MENDDGTMSAWYVMASMGLYPECVGRPVYHITTPVFNEVTIHLPTGRKLHMVHEPDAQVSLSNGYFLLNGKYISGSFITHQTLREGGRIIFK